MLSPKDEPLLAWRPFADEYLAKMMRAEGRGDGNLEVCYRCRASAGDVRVPLFRCLECFSEDLVCEECCREAHMEHPLHVVEVIASFA